jgi:hypothetical protein
VSRYKPGCHDLYEMIAKDMEAYTYDGDMENTITWRTII